jgi:hypothetical protein
MFNRLTTPARRAIFFERHEAHQAAAASIGTESIRGPKEQGYNDSFDSTSPHKFSQTFAD